VRTSHVKHIPLVMTSRHVAFKVASAHTKTHTREGSGSRDDMYPCAWVGAWLLCVVTNSTSNGRDNDLQPP